MLGSLLTSSPTESKLSPTVTGVIDVGLNIGS